MSESHVKADGPPEAQFELQAYAHGCATNPEVTKVIVQQAVRLGSGDDDVVIVRSYISSDTARTLARGLAERADIVDGLRDDVSD